MLGSVKSASDTSPIFFFFAGVRRMRHLWACARATYCRIKKYTQSLPRKGSRWRVLRLLRFQREDVAAKFSNCRYPWYYHDTIHSTDGMLSTHGRWNNKLSKVISSLIHGDDKSSSLGCYCWRGSRRDSRRKKGSNLNRAASKWRNRFAALRQFLDPDQCVNLLLSLCLNSYRQRCCRLLWVHLASFLCSSCLQKCLPWKVGDRWRGSEWWMWKVLWYSNHSATERIASLQHSAAMRPPRGSKGWAFQAFYHLLNQEYLIKAFIKAPPTSTNYKPSGWISGQGRSGDREIHHLSCRGVVVVVVCHPSSANQCLVLRCR